MSSEVEIIGSSNFVGKDDIRLQLKPFYACKKSL